MHMRRTIISILLTLIVISGGYFVWSSGRVQSWLAERQQSNLPPAENYQAVTNQNTTLNTNSANLNSVATNTAMQPLPAAKNLAVPFTSQAPHAKWDTDHGEFCEEASVLMTGRYFQGRIFNGPDDAEQGLQEIKKWEVEHLGYYFDTTAAETAQIIAGVYSLKVTLKENPTVTDIKLAISQGKLVLVPAAGRELGNPNFTGLGPIYHMLVIRGYTKDQKFITNDPGTRKGEQYIYDQSVVMAAIRDWVPSGDRTKPRQGDVVDGRPVILIVEPSA